MAKVTGITNGGLGGPTANGLAGPYPGAAHGGGAPVRKQPLSHIDDIVTAAIDFDRNKPMDKLLATAEALLRQADTYRTFGGRIDMALDAYIKANILLFEQAQQNRGWPALQTDNKAQRQKHTALARRVQDMHSAFEQIKLEIKADNARSGIQSRVQRSQPTEVPRTNAAPTPSTTPVRVKPSVRPKPEALHGHAIHTTGTLSKSPPKRAAEDLTARFSKLRATTAKPQQGAVQDPRINTQPIIPLPSAERRDSFTPTGRPSLSIDSTMLGLPQVPVPIYKPARGTVSTEAAELPSSSSRRFSPGRTLTSGSLSSPMVKTPTAGPIFEEPTWSDQTTEPKLTIAQGETISVTDLQRLMIAGFKSVPVLLVDIRSRDAFDEGHIMSQATICIEPEVLARKDISANQIAESMVLAPSVEQLHFERRHEFDLVVFYDQSSTRIGTRTDNQTELAVQGFYNALTFYDFGKSTPKPPKLLEGGVDAWTSLMGSNSLATTDSSVGQPRRSPQMTRKTLRTPARRKSNLPTPIQNLAEAEAWEVSANNPETYKTDINGVLRRAPEVLKQESMTSPPVASASTSGNNSQPTSHSVGPLHEPAPPRPTRIRKPVGFDSAEGVKEDKPFGKSKPDRRKTLVGLVNPNNLCYANSSLQSLFGTPGFANDLFSGQWERDYIVPKRPDEKIPNPQLLGKMLAQLFAWMDKALMTPMEARTLMQYLRHVHSLDSSNKRKAARDIFGDPDHQHDAQEFFSYLIEVLHDETNKHRDKTDTAIAHVDPRANHTTVLHEAVRYWHEHTKSNDSLVTKHWRGLAVNTTRCLSKACSYSKVTFEAADIIPLPVIKQQTAAVSPGGVEYYKTLEDSLAGQLGATEIVEDYECDECRENDRGRSTAELSSMVARLPERLVFSLKRAGESLVKIHEPLKFPIHGLNMAPYFVPADQRRIDTAADPEVARVFEKEQRKFDPKALYDCYAVICHIGPSVTSGHYVAYVRDHTSNDPTDWILFDDTSVTRVKVGSSKPDDVTENLYGKGTRQAYILLYERRP